MSEIKNISNDIFTIYKNFHIWNMYKLYSIVISLIIGAFLIIPVVLSIYLMWDAPTNIINLGVFQTWVFSLKIILVLISIFVASSWILFAIFLNMKYSMWIIDESNENNYYHYKLLALIPLLGLAYYFQERYTWFVALISLVWIWMFIQEIIKETRVFWQFLKWLIIAIFPTIWILSITFIISSLAISLTGSQTIFTIIVILWIIWAIYFFIRSLFSLFYLASDINDNMIEGSTYYIRKSLSEVDAIVTWKYLLYLAVFSIPLIILGVAIFYLKNAFPWAESVLSLITFLALTWYLTAFHIWFFKNVVLQNNI